MKVITYIEKALKIICIILFAALVCIVSFQVVSRMLFQKSYSVIEELSMFLLAWSTFMCTAYTARKKAHVRVEYFVNRFLTPRGREILELVLSSGMVLMMFVIIKSAFGFVFRQMKVKMVVLPFSKGLMYLSFPVGMIFFTIFLLDDCVHLVKRIRANQYHHENGGEAA